MHTQVLPFLKLPLQMVQLVELNSKHSLQLMSQGTHVLLMLAYIDGAHDSSQVMVVLT